MPKLVYTITSIAAFLGMASCTQLPGVDPCAPNSKTQSAQCETPLIQTLTANGFFYTIDAINKAGGLNIYREDGAAPRTIFAPTQSAWTNLAISLNYDSAPAMINQLPPAVLKALLQYNCLRTPITAADLGANSEWTSCFAFDGAYATVHTTEFQNAQLKQTTTAIRDAACNLMTIANPDIRAGDSIVHGTYGLAVGPGMFDIVSMLLSNPFSRMQLDTLGNEAFEFYSSLYELTEPITFFVPTITGLESAFDEVSPPGRGLLPDQISTLLKYQVAAGKVESNTFGEIPTLAPGLSFNIDSVGIPASQVTITTEDTGRPPVQILQADNVSSDGSSIYCVDKVLFPIYPTCEANPDFSRAEVFCEASATSENDCLAVKIQSFNANPAVSICVYESAYCAVEPDKEDENCAEYAIPDPIGGSRCQLYPEFCQWNPANPPDTFGTCTGHRGSGPDVAACAAVTLEANCNSIENPQRSMCVWVEATCTPDQALIENTCPVLNNTDCVSLEGSTEFNGEFCRQEEAAVP